MTPHASGDLIERLTPSDFDRWQFKRDAVHFNGGQEFFGWGHRCIDQPRLLVIDKYFKKDRSSQRSYLIDGRTPCTTLDEALAALSVPPVVTDADRELLQQLSSSEDWTRPEKRAPFLPLADMGLVEWGRDADNHVTCRVTNAGRAALRARDAQAGRAGNGD
jgi:hypothetical protein